MTREQIKGEGMFLLPPHPSKCQTCARQHEPTDPHDAQTMFYQTKFQMEHGRAPTWVDAMAHCDEETRRLWTEQLIGMGVDVAGGQVYPKKEPK